MIDISYPIVIAAAKTWFKLGDIDIRMTGMENIPESGGVLLAVNHLSFVDYLMAGYPGVQRGRLTRFMAKKEVFDHAVGRSEEHTSNSSHPSISYAVFCLKKKKTTRLRVRLPVESL